MRFLRNLLSISILAARRLWSNLGLMIGTAVGLIVAVALTMSIPLYANGVNYRLLTAALDQTGEGYNRPPFAFMFRYVGAWHEATDLESFQRANEYFSGRCQSIIGLAEELRTYFVKTDNLRLYPAGATAEVYQDPKASLDWIALGFVGNIGGHVEIVEGSLPAPQTADDSSPLQVMVSEDKANDMGLQVGEDYITMSPGEAKTAAYQIPIRITGIWRAIDTEEPFWFYAPDSFDTCFLTAEESWANVVAPKSKKPVYLALWYQVYDGHRVQTEDVPGFLGRVVVARTEAASALADTTLDVSPVDALIQFTRAASLLTILLYVFAIPIIGMILYFIVLTSNLVVQRQRNEIAVLRSRGTSAIQVVGLYLLEGVILGLLAMGLGPLLGQLVAYIMGRAQSFLMFGPSETPLLIQVSKRAMNLGLLAVGISVGASLMPALGAARHTIVTYKQDVARSLERPWWQRAYLDIFLLVVPLYGYYMLRQRGTISFLGQGAAGRTNDPFSNPLLFLVPTLFVFALALLFIRIFPTLMSVLAQLSQYFKQISLLLALRQLARSWKQYTGPLLLITLTLGMACFTASMAKTLDQALYDQTYYEIGADLHLVETGDNPAMQNPMASGPVGAGSGGTDSKENKVPDVWTFLPVSDHLKLPGVQSAARLGRFDASMDIGGNEISGTLLGVDRADFQRTAFFRKDFANKSLGSLMNLLARDDTAVLVPSSVLGTYGLGIGDLINVQVKTYNKTGDVPLTIVGTTELFPTVYPEDGAFWVCNLDYVFESLGGEYPYDVLLSTQPKTKPKKIVEAANDIGLHVLETHDARAEIADERERPERQGILGLLSVGFLASALLTVLGFLFYSFLSFRKRFIELGILRAIGLSTAQMATFLGLEQFALIFMGVAAGTGFGVLASKLFIPFLQVRGGAHPQVPPYAVQIAWGDIMQVYVIFGAMLLCAVAGLVYLLVQMRIAQAVKLGEVA